MNRLAEIGVARAEVDVRGVQEPEHAVGCLHVSAGGRTGFGEDAVIDAVDGGVGNQRIFNQIIEQHVEAENVVGDQQLGGR